MLGLAILALEIITTHGIHINRIFINVDQTVKERHEMKPVEETITIIHLK
jgi:hypothetical protein